MSEQPLTNEVFLEMFREIRDLLRDSNRCFNEKLEKLRAEFERETKERDAEFAKMWQETEQQMQEVRLQMKIHVADGAFDERQKEILRYIETCNGKCTQSMLCRAFRSLKRRGRTKILADLIVAKAIREEKRTLKNSRKRTTFYILNQKMKVLV